MKLFGNELKLFFVEKLSENWAWEIEFLKWMGSWGNFPVYENSIFIRFKGDHRGIYWSYYILGFKIIELNVYDVRHEEYISPKYKHGLDT